MQSDVNKIMDTEDIERRYNLAMEEAGLLPYSGSKDVDLRYGNRCDPREELAAMGLLPTDEIKGMENQQENEVQMNNPAAELAAMGLLPQGNFGGRPDGTECVANGVRRETSARTSYGASRKQYSPNGASRKRSSSPSSSSRKRTPPKEMINNFTRMNQDHASLAGGQGAFSADDACNMLMVICDKLGIIGVSFKSVLKRALEFEPDTHKMLKVFQESDTLSLMEVVSQKINDSAQNPKNDYDKEIMKKASVYIRTLIEKSKQECSEIIHGIDISHLAHVSFGKETKYIIQMIKTKLEYNGVKCVQSILSDIFQKVSMRHFSIMKSNENHKKSLGICNIPEPISPSSDNRVGVSELLRSENNKSDPFGLTESLMQVSNNKSHLNYRGNKQYHNEGFAQNLPHKRNSRERDSVDRKFRDAREVDGRSHSDRGNIGERNSVDRTFRDTREDDRRHDSSLKNLPYRSERDANGRRKNFDERRQGYTNLDEEQHLPYRGNSRGQDSVDRNFRSIRGFDERKDVLPEHLHYRNERDSHGRRDRLDEGDLPYKYKRNYESINGGINQPRIYDYGHEREKFKRNDSDQSGKFKGGRGHLSKRGASRQDRPHKDLEEVNRELRIRNSLLKPKFWESAKNKPQETMTKKDEAIKKKVETPDEAAPKMPTIQEMMDDLEQMQAMAEAEKEVSEASEEETNEDPQGPEGEPDYDQCQEELCGDTEAQRDNINENNESDLDVHNNDDVDDNLKEKFGNKGIAEIPWQELVTKLAPEGMMKPTDIDEEDENFESQDIAEAPCQGDDNSNSRDSNYGSENYNESQYNCNIGPDESYMNSYGNNVNEDNYYNKQNFDRGNANDDNYNHELMIPVKFIKDRSSNNENMERHKAKFSQENRTQFSEYQGDEYGTLHQYQETPNYIDHSIGSGQDPNTNTKYGSSYGNYYGDESTQSTNTSHSANSESYNPHDYSSEAQQTYDYDARESAYSYEGSRESQSYSQTMGGHSYDYIDQSSHSYPSEYKDESSLYQSGYKDESSLYQSGYRDESSYQQHNVSSNHPYNDSGYEAESSEYSIEMPVEFIKPKKLDGSVLNPAPNNTPPQNPPIQNSNTWLADQIKALASSNLGKEELAAKMAQIFSSQKLSIR